MKSILLLGFLLLNHTIGSSSASVYICDSSNAKKFHLSSNCRGLSNCQHRIIKVTLETAKKQGKTLCGWE